MPRVVLLVLLAGLLALPLLLKPTADSASPPPAVDDRYGFVFEEVAAASGIDVVHQAPQLDAKLDHIMRHVASMGAAVSVVDVDGDGWQDIYVTTSGIGGTNRLYRNLGDGRFTDIAGDLGIADVNRAGTGVSMGAVWGDYDNDGDEDLLLYKWGRPELFRNDGRQGFARVTEMAGLPAWSNSGTALWLDADNDGWLDIFIAGYWSERLDLFNLADARVMPESFEYANNGGRNHLLRNRGDGTFEDITEAAGLTSTRWTLAAVAADLDGSGQPDLFLANDYGVSELYINQGDGRFVEDGGRAGVGHSPKSGMNAAVGDVFNTGEFAIYETNISEEGILIQGNNLWVPQRQDGHLTYRNLAGALGVELGGWSFGAQFGDLNNDGFMDIYLTNGNVSDDPARSYWYDFSVIAGGHREIIEDARNWPPLDGRSLAGYQRKRVWINDGAGRFVDVAAAVGVNDRFDGRAVALADLWNRGVLDVIVANQRGPLLVYKNRVAADRNWIGFVLEGVRSNRSAIGAQLHLEWNGQRQVQEVSGGSGYSAQNQRPLHVGLGKWSGPVDATIRWPSGLMQNVPALQPGRRYAVREGEHPRGE